METQYVAGLLQPIFYSVLMDKKMCRRFRDARVFIQKEHGQRANDILTIPPLQDWRQKDAVSPNIILT